MVILLGFGAVGLALLSIYGLIRAIFWRSWRRRGSWLCLGAMIGCFACIIMAANLDAQSQGWASSADKQTAKELGITSPQAFADHQKQAAATAAQEQAATDAARKQAGFHCVSAWDGHHPDFIRKVKRQMRDPDSFEPIETRIAPVNDQNQHPIQMQYRSKNGFGGYTVGMAIGLVDHENCDVTVLKVE